MNHIRLGETVSSVPFTLHVAGVFKPGDVARLEAFIVLVQVSQLPPASSLPAAPLDNVHHETLALLQTAALLVGDAADTVQL